VAYERLEPGGAIIGIATRCHEDDTHGWLLKEHAAEGWTVINLPALAEHDDPLGQDEGEPLWAARYPLAALERIRAPIGTTAWLSLYQGRPAPEEKRGPYLKRSGSAPNGGPLEVTRTVFSLDTAFKTKESNDYSAIVVISEAKTGFHVRLVMVRRGLRQPPIPKTLRPCSRTRQVDHPFACNEPNSNPMLRINQVSPNV
jgi:hypothetical protein